MRAGAGCRGRHRRSSPERQLRGWPAQVGAGERHGGVGRQRHPALGDLRLRGVHRVGPQAGRHAAGGAAGRARRAPGQRGLHPAAPRRGARRLLRHHLQRGADVRAGGGAQRVGEPRVGCAPDADHLRQQRLGLVRLGLQGEAEHRDARHPQPRRGGGPRLRPAHRRRRHPGAVPADARQGEHAQERRVRGGPLLPAQRVVGRAGAAKHRGRPLAAPRLDDRLLQGRQVRGRRALRRAPGRARRRAGGRAGERAGPGGAHRARVELPPRLRRGGLRRRLHGVHGRRGLRGARHRQGAVRVQGHRRVQARRARLHGRRQPHTRRVPEHLLPHEGRRHALRPARRRRLRRRPAQEACRRRPPPPAVPVRCLTPRSVAWRRRRRRRSDGVILVGVLVWCVRGICVPCAPCGCSGSGVALGVFLL